MMLPCEPGPPKRLWSTIGCFGLILGCAGSSVIAPAQQATASLPAAQPPLSSFSVTSREVLLDIVATDDAGRPVTGLTSADFTVKEEDAPQTLLSLSEQRGMSPAQQLKAPAQQLKAPAQQLKAPAQQLKAPALPPNTFTNATPVENTQARTVVLLDAQDTPMPAQMFAREELIGYLEHIQPGAQIAIFQLGVQFRLIQGFTSDQGDLLAAAQSKRDMPAVRPPGYVRYDDLHDALSMLSRYLAGFPGRKSLILFTARPRLWPPFSGRYGEEYGEGFGHLFPDSYAVVPGNFEDFTDVMTMSRVAVYPVDARGLRVDPQFRASVAGVPSTTEDLRFFRHEAFDDSVLDAVATATGGKAFYNTNGLQQAMAQVIEESSNYYTLAYNSTNRNWDGGFRRIRVSVDRPGVHLQYRDGYYAYDRQQQEQRQIARLQQRKAATAAKPVTHAAEPSPDEAEGALVRHSSRGGFIEDMGLGAIPPTEIVFVASVQPEDQITKVAKHAPLPPDNFLRPEWQHKPFRNYELAFRADAHRIKLTEGADGGWRGTVDFVAVVYEPTGAEVNSVEKTTALDLTADEYQEVLAHGLSMQEELAVPAEGEYFLRLGVHDEAGDRVGALEIAADRIRLGAAGAALQRP